MIHAANVSPARFLTTGLLLLLATASISQPCAAQLQSFQVDVLNGPAQAGNAQTLQITAQTFLNLPIPLFDPQTDITITVAGAPVTFSNPSGGFPLSSDGVISATGVVMFDAQGRFTCDMVCSLAGTFNVSVTDGTANGATTVTWTPGAAHHMSFGVQTADVTLGQLLLPSIVVLDSFGNTVLSDARTITLSLLAHPSGAMLQGTTSVNAAAGVATWQDLHDLQVSASGTGFVLRASHGGAALTGSDTVDSSAFDVSEPSTNGNANDNSSGGNQNSNSNANSNANSNTNGTGGGPTDDSDGDGTPDTIDDAPNDGDANDNGIPDGEETDSDSDGLVDARDPNPTDPDSDDDGRLDGADNCPTWANADQADSDGNGVGDVCEDDDGDGVINGLESAGPHDGDGNQDGTPDSQQPNVATLRDGAGYFVTLIAPSGARLVNVRLLANPSVDDAPAVEFPVGFVGYTLADLPTPGVTAQLQMIFHWADGTTVDNFYNFGPLPEKNTPHWYQFVEDGDCGATIQGNIVTLKLIDGGRGDDDLTANGQVTEVGGPALGWIPEPTGCGGALCGPTGVGMISLTLAGLGVFKLARRRAG